MLQFLNDLMERGEVTVPGLPDEVDPATMEEAVRLVEARSRAELPGTPPKLEPAAAIWALKTIENACRFFVYRELGIEVMEKALGTTCPAAPSPAVCYSVDLFFRYLPDLFVLAKGSGSSDPLLEYIQNHASRWPLSSVGMPGIEYKQRDIDYFYSNDCLRHLYIDRIIECNDTARLGTKRALEDVKAALGDYLSLAPRMMEFITKSEKESAA